MGQSYMCCPCHLVTCLHYSWEICVSIHTYAIKTRSSSFIIFRKLLTDFVHITQSFVSIENGSYCFSKCNYFTYTGYLQRVSLVSNHQNMLNIRCLVGFTSIIVSHSVIELYCEIFLV